ncbi:single-strand DNA-binding protein [Paraglaciecola Antarctic JLT virus 2]|nr:single-strand DNA-binding protein [Paraglaciecola Antarctic JLT virus 2]
MNKSDSIKELAGALNKAQAEMSGAKKRENNPFFKKKYADMNSVVDAVRVPFCENGLSYAQFPLFENGCVGVETILMHESGEWISNILMLPMVKQDPQAAGSAITYARRYSLQSIAGIPSEDDDGNSTRQAAKPSIDIAAVAKECGYTNQQVCETFDPALASLRDIQDPTACAAYLRANKL